MSAAAWLAARRLRNCGPRNDREDIARVRREVEEFREIKRAKLRGLSKLLFEPIRFVLRRLLLVRAPISNSGLIAASMLNEADRLREV